MNPSRLLNLVGFTVVHQMSTMPTKNYFIGIDEIRLICLDVKQASRIQPITTQIGHLVVALQERGITATVIISALTNETFRTVSNRPILEVFLPQPNKSSHEFVRDQLLPTANDKQKAVLEALCGFHFRSIAVACELLKLNQSADLPRLHALLADSLRIKMDATDESAVRHFVIATCAMSVAEAEAAWPWAAQFAGADGAVPPAIVCHAFEQQDGFTSYEHPAQLVFGISPFADATKQLELCGFQFDRFRALYRLPIIPYSMNVANSSSIEWFKQLRFAEAIVHQRETGALLETKGKKVCRTSLQLELGKYYFPSCSNHPWIDRAVIASHRVSGEQCLVLYQDKINKNSFADAVRALNAAANAFRTVDPTLKILCVAQVVGATLDTTAQSSFEHPYLLVRDPEVIKFFTPTFAPAVTFLRARHELPE